MLSTWSISFPANLDIFGFGLSENLSDGGTTSRKRSRLSSAIFQTSVKLDAVRSLDGLCLLVHCRLYQRIYVDSFFFFVLKF